MAELNDYEGQARALAAHWIDTMSVNVRDFIAIADAFRSLVNRAEASEVEKVGAEERCRMLFEAKNYWAERARAAEAKLAELEAK